MPIAPDTHTLWYQYVFQGLTLEDNTRTEAIAVRAWGYQQCISMAAFLYGAKRKHTDAHLDTRVENNRKYDPHRRMLWIGKIASDYQLEQEMDVKHTERYAVDHPTTAEYFRTLHPEPTRSFDTAYKFYDHICYDRKTKRFRKCNS